MKTRLSKKSLAAVLAAVVLKFRCNGETVKSENDHLIFNPIAH